MSDFAVSSASAADKKQAEKPVAYLNLSIIDANGVKHRLKTGVPIGGKYEKGLSASLLKKLGEPNYEFKLVGTLNSAETTQKEIAL